MSGLTAILGRAGSIYVLAGLLMTGVAVSAATSTEHDIVLEKATKGASPQLRVGRGGLRSMPPQMRKSIPMRASAEWKP